MSSKSEAGENQPVTQYQKPTKWQLYFRRRKDAVVATIILGPMLFWWLVVGGLPTLFGFFLGFFDWVGLNSSPDFIWFGNYIRFFQDPIYYMALWRAIWLGLLVTGLIVVIGFGAAMLMNMALFGKGIYRTLWYIPVVTATVAVTQIFNIFMDPYNGVVNNLLTKWFDMEPIFWQYSVFWSVMWIVIFSVWKGVGGSALIWLAGLQSVDPIQYEAAEIDGANRWQKFIHVTLPGVKPIATYIVITGLIGAIQIYEQVFFITNGGPYGQTEVLMYRIVRDAFFDYNLGMAGASSVIMALVVFIMTISYFKFATDTDRKDRKTMGRGGI